MPRTFLPFALALLSLAACQKQAEPKYVSSAGEPGYAEQYPEMISEVVAEFEEDDARVTSESEKFSSFPGALKEPVWREVVTVFYGADKAGTRSDFVAQMEDAERVERFYSARRDKIRQKVIGAANYAAKQKPCEVELSGPIAGSLDKSIEHEIREGVREHNPTHRYIADHEDRLGPKNVEKLKEQADSVSELSYLVRVKMPRAKQELDDLIQEESDIRRTLDLEKKEAEATLGDLNASKAAKERAQARAKGTNEALARLDADLEKAKALAAKLEELSADATKRYEKAFNLLQATLEDKADEAEEKPSKAEKTARH